MMYSVDRDNMYSRRGMNFIDTQAKQLLHSGVHGVWLVSNTNNTVYLIYTECIIEISIETR